MIDIDIILSDLKTDKDPRTKKSLDMLNKMLSDHHEAGEKDFSVTSIGRLSSSKGGPGYESLRATRNSHYRRLIEAWASKSGTGMKKPLAEFSRSREIPTDNKLLERLDDPALRAIFGQIIAERNRYRNEVNLLKQHANIVIDKRPVRQFDSTAETAQDNVEVLPALTGVLTNMEISALKYSISDECMEKQNWQYTNAGQVKDMEYNTEILPRGFVNGIRKLLNEISNN